MILEVKNGSFSYGSREVLKDVSFHLEEQKIMTILGPNGVGKTTLLKCIMGFLQWNSGGTMISGKSLTEYSDKELWRKISYVPQAKQSVFSYGVLEMVVMGLDKENGFFYSPKKEHFERADEMLKELGIGRLADRYCNELSGGELQMVMLARAMVSGPELLILDEPMNGLDKKGVSQMREIFLEYKKAGNSILMATHNPQDVEILCDHVYEMDDGVIEKIY